MVDLNLCKTATSQACLAVIEDRSVVPWYTLPTGESVVTLAPTKKRSSRLEHRQVCLLALSWVTQRDAACWVGGIDTKIGKGIADVLAITHPSEKDRQIHIIECKRSRADLLADLRVGKMLKYEEKATHCHLMCTHECFLDLDPCMIEIGLKNLGLPDTWGIMLIDSNTLHTVALRAPARLSAIGWLDLARAHGKISQAWMHRSLRECIWM